MTVRAPAGGLQHRAVCLRLQTSPVTHEAYRWCRPPPTVGCGLWTAAALCAFTGLRSSNTDAAWRCWHLHAGGDPRPSTVACSSPWAGGWAVGAEEGRIATLWRRQRQSAAEYTAAGDARADRCLAQITMHVNQQSAMRLLHWREDMHTHGGASAWLKRRADDSCSLQHVLHWDGADKGADAASDRSASPLDTETMQCSTASELAGRWNAGLFRYRRDTARPPQLSKIAEADFCTTLHDHDLA